MVAVEQYVEADGQNLVYGFLVARERACRGVLPRRSSKYVNLTQYVAAARHTCRSDSLLWYGSLFDWKLLPCRLAGRLSSPVTSCGELLPQLKSTKPGVSKLSAADGGGEDAGSC